jgi:hypothetical protein
MDPYALVSGQHQLSHVHDEAALEMAYADLIARSTHDCNVVITGAPVTLAIDDQCVDPRKIHAIKAGQTLSIKATKIGIYSYLHISGGIATEPVFQSRSTSPREVIGVPIAVDAHTAICARVSTRRILSCCDERAAENGILGHAQRQPHGRQTLWERPAFRHREPAF